MAKKKTTGGKTTDSSPKGTVRYRTYKGQRIKETSLGGGKWEGSPVRKPKGVYKPKKAKTNYKSTRSKSGRPKKGY